MTIPTQPDPTQYNQLKDVPVELANVSPGPGFSRMPIPDHEGLHTGGPFLSPDCSEVWKPLDTVVNQFEEERVTSQEHLVLNHMQGQPGFPANWRICFQASRLWLVRPRCKVFGQDIPTDQITRAQVNHVRKAIVALNAEHWEIGDSITVAIDSQTGEPFILDLSSARYQGFGPGDADDWHHLRYWLEEKAGPYGKTELELIVQARTLLLDENAGLLLNEDESEYRYAYLCYGEITSRTLSHGEKLVHINNALWLISKEPCTELNHRVREVQKPIQYRPWPQSS